MPGSGRNLFSTALAAQKGVNTIFTKAGSIVHLGLFSMQLTRSDNLDHLDLAISKERKRTESACCAISGKTFSKETSRKASIPQKSVALSSAVSMNTDQRALQDGSSVVGNDNDSPTYGINNRTVGSSTNKRSEVSCCEKNNSPSSLVVDGIDKGSKSSDDLEYEHDGIQNGNTSGSDNVEDGDEVKKQDSTLTLRFIEKNVLIGIL